MMYTTSIPDIVDLYYTGVVPVRIEIMSSISYLNVTAKIETETLSFSSKQTSKCDHFVRFSGKSDYGSILPTVNLHSYTAYNTEFLITRLNKELLPTGSVSYLYPMAVIFISCVTLFTSCSGVAYC